FGACGSDERGSELGHTWAARCRRHARRVLVTRPAVGHAEPDAFMARLDHSYAEPVQRVHPVHVAVAHHAEDVRGAFGLEGFCQPFVDFHSSFLEKRGHPPAFTARIENLDAPFHYPQLYRRPDKRSIARCLVKSLRS